MVRSPLWMALVALAALALLCGGIYATTGAAAATERAQPGLVGTYGAGIQTYPDGSMYARTIANASWMARLSSGVIVTNNEWGGDMYWLQPQKPGAAEIIASYDVTQSGLAGVVHLLEHGPHLYVACYGGVAPPTNGGYCRMPKHAAPASPAASSRGGGVRSGTGRASSGARSKAAHGAARRRSKTERRSWRKSATN